LEQREALDRQIKEMRNAQRAEVIERIRQDVANFELTERDVFGSATRSGARKGGTVAAKYRNPETGETWTGRGKAPKWISDKDRTQYLIP